MRSEGYTTWNKERAAITRKSFASVNEYCWKNLRGDHVGSEPRRLVPYRYIERNGSNTIKLEGSLVVGHKPYRKRSHQRSRRRNATQGD